MGELRAISFDAADTLIYLPRGVGEPYAEIAGKHGIERPPAEWKAAFYAAWKAAPAPEITPDGGPSPDDQRGWWAALVHEVLVHLGEYPADEEALFAELYAYFAQPGAWLAYPEAAEVLEDLRSAGIRLAVISNFDRRLYENLRHEGLLGFFEKIYVSSEHGADKPHPRMFERFLTDFGLRDTPELALHVGDHPDLDWAAAKAVGMRVLELDREGGHTLRGLLMLRSG